MQFPDISPVAFSLFGFGIRWYAIAYIAGFTASFYYVKHQLKKSTDIAMSYKGLDELVSHLVVGIILGGRLGYVLFYNFSHYLSNPLEILMVWTGGMSFHGGLIGAALALLFWARKEKIPFFRIADLLVTPAPIGLFLGRIANFVNAELYGRTTSSKFGVIFPNSDGLPRHPSQLYEAALEGITLFAVLHILRRIRGVRKRPGIISFAFVACYAVARIAVEFFREPDAQIGFLPGGITMGQMLTLPALAAAIIGIIVIARRPAPEEKFITSPLLNDFPFIENRFFTRRGGVSSGVFATANCRFETSDATENVKKNRGLHTAAMGIASECLVTVNQKHTNRVVVIDRPVKDASIYLAEEADAIITNQPGLAIGVLTADCVPVLLVDAQNRWIAALHCGWKGIHRGIIEETVDCLDKLGSNRGDIRAALGPCLKQRHYEVDEDFMKDITAQDPGCRTLFRRPRGKPGKYLFDCSGYAVRKLKKAGIRNIDLLDFDTFDADLFFSYRRSLLSGEYAGTDAADEGRQMSAIALRD